MGRECKQNEQTPVTVVHGWWMAEAFSDCFRTNCAAICFVNGRSFLTIREFSVIVSLSVKFNLVQLRNNKLLNVTKCNRMELSFHPFVSFSSDVWHKGLWIALNFEKINILFCEEMSNEQFDSEKSETNFDDKLKSFCITFSFLLDIDNESNQSKSGNHLHEKIMFCRRRTSAGIDRRQHIRLSLPSPSASSSSHHIHLRDIRMRWSKSNLNEWKSLCWHQFHQIEWQLM